MTNSQQRAVEPVRGVLPVVRGWRPGSAESRVRARELAEELRQLTGERPSVTWGGGGAVRVSVRVRELREWDRAAAVLVVLARGDRYGHRRTERWQCVWTEVGAAVAAVAVDEEA
ncbi:hypothetical protein OU787_03105 [Kitasatospora sp. YST-16]|uniref:hypothetical protein n=1 Tax=unclassified Kitasatospora TaxID=2633591 RepID=UPI0004C2F2A8|nr:MULTISPECIES: hypothetical protein [unclassified Kitasatospora]WAL70571.1 hypothetical protein OU787_03105 [Kitasatospora sp. YST-16]